MFTRHTTEAINVLANALPGDAGVVVFAGEHHADLLPWLRGPATVLPVPASPDEALGLLDDALVAARGGVGLVAVTGASNVTGEIWPYAEIADIAHRHGARLLLDAAQLAPHRPIDMAATGIDYLAFSGHKLYAPFGTGVLVGRPDWLGDREPLLAGGGAVHYVTVDSVIWAEPPDRHEAGSPNVVGAVALGVACRTLQAAGMAAVAAAEHELVGDTAERLAAIPGVRPLRMGHRATPGSACSRSRSRGCRTRRWPPRSARSTASGCGTGASAPTRSSHTCSTSTRRRSAGSGGRSSATNLFGFRVRSARASGWPRPPTTSIGSSPR